MWQGAATLENTDIEPEMAQTRGLLCPNSWTVRKQMGPLLFPSPHQTLQWPPLSGVGWGSFYRPSWGLESVTGCFTTCHFPFLLPTSCWFSITSILGFFISKFSLSRSLPLFQYLQESTLTLRIILGTWFSPSPYLLPSSHTSNHLSAHKGSHLINICSTFFLLYLIRWPKLSSSSGFNT